MAARRRRMRWGDAFDKVSLQSGVHGRYLISSSAPSSSHVHAVNTAALYDQTVSRGLSVCMKHAQER